MRVPIRYKLSTALIIALAAVLLAPGLTRADGQSRILERLFPYEKPGEAAARLVTPVGMGMSDGPCAISIDEYLFDGGELHVAWTAKSESRDTVLFSAGDLESPDVKFLHHDDTESLLINNFVPLGGSMNRVAVAREFHGYTVVTLPDNSNGKPFDVTLRGVFMKPVAPVVMDSEIKEDIVNRPTWVASQHGYQMYLSYWSNVTPDGDGGYSADARDLDPYFDALTRDFSEAERVDAYVKGLIGQNYGQLLSKLVLTFTVSPDKARIYHTEIIGPSTFEFDDQTVTITKADFTAAHTSVEGMILAKGGMTEESLFDLHYELRPDGKPPAAQISNERNSGDTVNGRACIEFDLDGDPLPEAPSMLLLEAYRYPEGFTNDSEGKKNEPVRAPQYDIEFRLKKTP